MEWSGQLRRRFLKTSEIYAAFGPDYRGTVPSGIDDIIQDLQKVTGAALHPKLTRKHGNVAVLRV